MKRFFYFMASYIALFILGGCKDVVQSLAPELEVQDGIYVMTVSSEGGMQSISYSISNPVEGAKIEAIPEKDWVNGMNYETENVIVFNVDANETQEGRTCVMSVVYVYGDEEISKEIEIVQQAGLVYDLEYEMPFFTGLYYGEDACGAYSYYTWVSDMEILEDYLVPQTGGLYYLFDIYGPAPEDNKNILLPSGTYELVGPNDKGEYVFTSDRSQALRYSEDGLNDYNMFFVDGVITVSYDEDGVMNFEAVLTDTEGKAHHVVYSGDGKYTNLGPVEPGIGEDIDFTASRVSATYNGRNGERDIMEVLFQFTDMSIGDDGYVTPPGTILSIDAFMPFDKDGNIATGEYVVSQSADEGFVAFTLRPANENMGWTGGTFAEHLYSRNEYYITYINQGTMIVEGGNGEYTVNCDFLCTDGYKVTCSWSGALLVEGMPSPFSTLEGDYKLNLEGAKADGYNWGDMYGTGGDNWYITIMPDGGTDGFQADFVTEVRDFSEGIPSGTYVASATDYPSIGEYLQGYMSAGGALGGTMYLGDFTEDGLVQSCAPAMSGNLVIVNNGDGTYDISFSFLDDLGHTWEGEWSGSINLNDYSPTANVRKKTDFISAIGKKQ